MAGVQLQYKRGNVVFYENKERAELQKFLFFFSAGRGIYFYGEALMEAFES